MLSNFDVLIDMDRIFTLQAVNEIQICGNNRNKIYLSI